MTNPVGVIGGVARVLSPGPGVEVGAFPARSCGMDGMREFLSAVRDAGLIAGNFRGLLHIAIGRTITRPDGSVYSSGVTWRALAAELKQMRFDTEIVRELGADPDDLAARDRERFWYSAIAAAKVDSPEAFEDADRLAAKVKTLGFVISPARTTAPPTRPKPVIKEKEPDPKQAKKKKK